MRALRLLLLAVMLLAPVGRIGVAQAMAAPAATPPAMAGHCADAPAAAPAHHRGSGHDQAPQQHNERTAVDCMIACAAMTTAPAPFVAPAPPATSLPDAPLLASLTGIRPEAEPPPPRRS